VSRLMMGLGYMLIPDFKSDNSSTCTMGSNDLNDFRIPSGARVEASFIAAQRSVRRSLLLHFLLCYC
jgi:hypothetical protein